LATTLGISDQAQFPGRLAREEVLTAMSHANAFVLSSRYETFGVVVIEALALGLPVVSTRCGGPESIVREQDGILVPVDNVEALAEAMVKIYESQNQYNPAEIRDACRDRFSEKAVANRLMKIYSDISSHREHV
jgi:glycosyltransferase involved in cell wall biosynthesis